ncbi:MAG: hypothetical protein AMXMBFR82_35610 [Candidatus Hydrogenedentota bacterium]
MRVSVFTAFLFLGISATANATVLHIAPDGADTNPGTQDSPLATFHGTRDAVRELRQQSDWVPRPITILVQPGRYHVSESWSLTADDGGSLEAPVEYKATARGVVLLGGRYLNPEGFQPITGAALVDRLVPEAGGHVMNFDLEASGITDLGAFPNRFENAPPLPELFFNGARMTLARWPNDDWATIASIVDSGPAPWRNHSSDKLGVFEYSGDRPERWGSAPEVWLHGYWCFDWSAETIKVGAIDTENHRITLSEQHHYGLGSGNPAPRRYYATNLLEELDQPGEYFIDRAGGQLYFWPPGDMSGADIVLSTLAGPVIALDNVSHVRLEGLTVETCVGTGIDVKDGEGITIQSCTVRNTGQDGIVINGGTRHTVAGCDIYDTGTAGLRVSGGDRKTLTPCNHVIDDNHIWRISRRQRTHAYNIHMDGVGIQVTHNLLHDAPHQAIGLGGNDHLIEFNEIHHSGMETDDSGAFYMGRNPSMRGTIIRHNYWHHIGSALTHGSCAIYFDDGSGGQTVIGNVFYKAAGGNFGAVFVHGGHDNDVINNIFVDCKRAIGAAPWDDNRWWDYVAAPLWQQVLLQDVDITQPPYTTKYPGLVGFMERNDRPRLNRAARNLVVRCDEFINGNWDEHDNYVTAEDPGFVDMAQQNFGLQENAQAFSALPAFEPIPFAEMGLRTSRDK